MTGDRRAQVELVHLLDRDEDRHHAGLADLRRHIRRRFGGGEHHVDRTGALVRADHFEDERHPGRVHEETSLLADLTACAGSHALSRTWGAARQHPAVRAVAGAVDQQDSPPPEDDGAAAQVDTVRHPHGLLLRRGGRAGFAAGHRRRVG
ncbi:MAG TPA: hypothetical protein VMV92_23130 [Streptosporangiaceae bacterium]|nr:hypothetical protein [Streptosporangiaceae bacterium]